MALRAEASHWRGAPQWETAAEPCRTRLHCALEALGPVLLVSRLSFAADARWRLGSVIDAYGVREFVEASRWRLYRLPDSDFLGWERLSHLCEPWVPMPQPLRMSRSHCASLARYASGGWNAVAHLSDVGWELTQTILRLEAAHLRRSAWLDVN
jgi:hypothetical protein